MSRVLPRPEVAIITTPAPDARLVGRALHPWAWWAWAIGCAVTVSLASNPLLLVGVVAAVVFVVLQRRTDDPWARSLKLYFILAAIIIVARLIFQILIGGLREGTVLFRLPELALPSWAAGIRLGGPVTVEGLVYTAVDAGRLAGLLICIGAANALANPKRALKNVPAAFHQVATALVIAISVAPQLISSALRVRRARRLRGQLTKGVRGVVAIVVPVIEDAIERSMSLAASMESRGYGRTRTGVRLDWRLGLLLVGAMLIITFAAFALLGLPSARSWAAPLLLVGIAAAAFGLHRSSQTMAISRYRPDPWGGVENLVSGCGLVAAGTAIWLVNTDSAMVYGGFPISWPAASWPMLLTIMLAGLPGVLAPAPPGGHR